MFLHLEESDSIGQELHIIFGLFAGNARPNEALGHREATISIVFIVILVLWLLTIATFHIFTSVHLSFIILRLLFMFAIGTAFLIMTVLLATMIVNLTSTTVADL